MNDLQNRATDLTSSKPQRDYILLDCSSSMTARWWESLAAIDAYVAGLKAQSFDSHITLATFSKVSQMCYEARPDAQPGSWVPLSNQPPGFFGGSTPLYDAINVMMRELRDMDPPRCSILIVTDGDENGSDFTTLVQAKALLDWARMKGWQVTFMGCDFDATSAAKQLGATDANTVSTSAKQLSSATIELARKRANYGTHAAPMHWSEAERSRFGGYLGRS